VTSLAYHTPVFTLCGHDQKSYGILQPIPWQFLDHEFQIDGWRLIAARSGFLKRKEVSHVGSDLQKKASIKDEIRAGWTIARTNTVTTMKVAIPLIFLIFLNYYTLFLPFSEANAAVGILTTTFLSGIALYFSTEKPQPLRMTTIDLIFLYYYLQVGTSILVVAVSSFVSEDFFSNASLALKWALPIVSGLGVALLSQRVKSVKLRPRVSNK